jgi:hypothetical protein
LFAVPCEEAPKAPLTLQDGELGELFDRYEGLYLWNKSERHAYPEAFVADLASSLSIPGLSYLLQSFRLLRSEEIDAAVGAYEALLELCAQSPEQITCRGWNPDFGADSLRAAMRLPERTFWAHVEKDDPDAASIWKFLGFIRANLAWMKRVDKSRECVVYVFD